MAKDTCRAGPTRERDIAGTGPTPDAEQAEANRRKHIEEVYQTIDFMTTWEEAEKRKKAAIPTEVQK